MRKQIAQKHRDEFNNLRCAKYTISLNRFRWFGHEERMEEKRIPKREVYTNFGRTRLRGRQRNRWQDKVREDGRIVGGRKKKKHNREEWKKRLRTARNRHILHMPMEWNE